MGAELGLSDDEWVLLCKAVDGLPGTTSMLDERLWACDVGFAGRRGIDPTACVPRVSCGRSISASKDARGSVYARSNTRLLAFMRFAREGSVCKRLFGKERERERT